MEISETKFPRVSPGEQGIFGKNIFNLNSLLFMTNTRRRPSIWNHDNEDDNMSLHKTSKSNY